MESHLDLKARTVAEVADLLGVSGRTVRRRITDGSIRSIRLGRVVRVPGQEVARILDA